MRNTENPNIYYYLPSANKPSWGAGMICYHVWFLQNAGFNAYLLTDSEDFNHSWLSIEIPIICMRDGNFKMNKEDFLIVPEFFADSKYLTTFKCKKIVFVQNGFYVFDGLTRKKAYEELGYNYVFYYMQHLHKMLTKFTSVPVYEVPPFIASYFYTKGKTERKKRILIYPKFSSRDYVILNAMLRKKLEKELGKSSLWNSKREKWEIIELKNMSHYEVAQEMNRSMLFICLNTSEAFNSSIPEAMAAGCINICYDGFGSADFLTNNQNAFVFQNNYIFDLIEKTVDIVKNFQNYEQKLIEVRENGYQTADLFREEKTKRALINFFSKN